MRGEPLEQYRGYLLGWLRNSESTYDRYVHSLRFLERSTGKPFLSDLSIRLRPDDVVQTIIANPQLAPETCSMFLKAAKSWEKAGGFLKWWTPNGLLDLTYPKPASTPRPSLTPRQVQILVETCRTAREWRLVGLGLYAGMRVGDAEALTEQEWLDDRLRYTAAKTKRLVEVPIHRELDKLKRVILNDSPAKGSLKVLGNRLSKRTPFDWCPNTLRATFTQRLLDLGTPLWVVKDLRGDSPKEVVFAHYATVPFPHKVEAIERLHY